MVRKSVEVEVEVDAAKGGGMEVYKRPEELEVKKLLTTLAVETCSMATLRDIYSDF